MADPRRRGLRWWPWRWQKSTTPTSTTALSGQEVAEKLIELVHFERGAAALYYYRPDTSLAALAQNLNQSHRTANMLEPGVDRDIGARLATPAVWTSVSAVWQSAVWQPGEILVTFSTRLIDLWRADDALWSVVVDPRAQFFGSAVTADETQRYWWVLVTGQKGLDSPSGSETAAR
jgi:hypothetical protein